MANSSIRADFVNGVQEIFSTLFNDQTENDGVYLYLLSDQTTTNVYGETKTKVYKDPVLLTCKANLSPTYGDEPAVEVIKDKAVFTVTYKTLADHSIPVDSKGLESMRQGKMKFHDVFYTVDNVSPRTYVEDTFLFYAFDCTEDKQTTSLTLESKDEGGE